MARLDIAKQTVVYTVPGMDAVPVRRDIEYAVVDGEAQTLDVYYPPEPRAGVAVPVVVFVTGFPDAGMKAAVGCRFKEMGSYTSWARLVAASGMSAVLYTNHRPAEDVKAVLEYLRAQSAPLGVNARCMGVWACSANVPNALAVLSASAKDAGLRERVRCAALCYGYMLDIGGATHVADAQRTFRFANAEGLQAADLPAVPLFIARAGRDETPHVNDSLDLCAAEALRLNLPLTLVNHPTGPHAFDIVDDSPTSREIVKQILGFFRHHLLPA
jgi:hypothetical protein